MYRHKIRFLFAALLVLLLFLTPAQATTTLLITVQDSIDHSPLSHATVFVNGANYARTNTLGQAYLTHTGLNDQSIMVSMAGYDDWDQEVDKNTTTLLVNLSRKTLRFTVNLFDSDTLSPISGATVNISADNLPQSKQTDGTGSAIFAVNATTIYSVDITAPNYQSRSELVDMGTENQDVQYKLLSGNSFSFIVKDKDSGTVIPGAEIHLNGVLTGKTDERGILITPVTRSKPYTIEIRKDGYLTSTETRTISTSDAIFYATLSKAPVGAFVYVSDESKKPLASADVYVNGTLSGTTNEYGRMNLQSLVAGDYLIEVKKSGYLTQNRALSISGQNSDYSFTLPYESAALTITVLDRDNKNVSGASVSVDGSNAGTTNDDGQMVTNVPFNTDVNLTVTKEGYAPASVKKQVIQGNATAATTITLEKNIDWGLLTLIGLGALGILVLFGIIRIIGSRTRHHVMRRNEI